MRSRGALSLVVALCGLMLVAGVAHAQATASDGTRPPDFTGPCTVQATILETGATIDPSASGGVYSVPVAGSASWSGEINVARVPERPTGGRLHVLSPAPVPPFTLDSWTEPRDTAYEDAGELFWELPDYTPRGIPFTVRGEHQDLQNCTGSITVKVAGGIFDSPIGIASVAITVVTGLGLVLTGLPRGGQKYHAGRGGRT